MKLKDMVVNGEPLYAWGRYLYWAELAYCAWDKYMAEHGAEPNIPEWLGVSSCWAASLYVAIEGWEDAKFQDSVIDALLGVSEHKEMLRRMRNATFHYQPTLTSEKFATFLKAPDALFWLFTLHTEFCRWLRDYVETVARSARLSQEQSQEWRDGFASIVGWLPLRPAEQELESLRKLTVETKNELDTSGDDSDAAKELLASLKEGYDTAIRETAERVREVRRGFLSQFGLNPDNYIA